MQRCPRFGLVEKEEQAVGRSGEKIPQDHADAFTRHYFLHVAGVNVADAGHATAQVFRQFCRRAARLPFTGAYTGRLRHPIRARRAGANRRPA